MRNTREVKEAKYMKLDCDCGELCVCAPLLIKDTHFEASVLAVVFIMDQSVC